MSRIERGRGNPSLDAIETLAGGLKVSVVELTKTLIPGCDRDLVKPLEKRITARYEAIMLGTRVVKMEAGPSGITVHFDGEQAPAGPQV